MRGCCLQGGGLQIDGSPYSNASYHQRYPGAPPTGYGSCSAVFPFTYFFERSATLLQHKDPQAASYCKWYAAMILLPSGLHSSERIVANRAARALFRRISPYNDFPNVYYIVKALGEEKAQLKAGGPIPIPDLVDMRSKTIMKNEYQHDKQRHDGGPVPAQHVLCPSRAPGSPYVQSSVYMVRLFLLTRSKQKQKRRLKNKLTNI